MSMIRQNQGPDYIQHCEKYLFDISDDLKQLTLKTDELNNYEKGMVFDYLYFKLRQKAVEDKGGFFPIQIFLAMITSHVYDILKRAGNPQDILSYSEAVTESLDKIWKLRTWYENGQPKDDDNLLIEIAKVMAAGQKNKFELFMQMLEQNQQKGKL